LIFLKVVSILFEDFILCGGKRLIILFVYLTTPLFVVITVKTAIAVAALNFSVR
jgi:hypothetical protein